MPLPPPLLLLVRFGMVHVFETCTTYVLIAVVLSGRLAINTVVVCGLVNFFHSAINRASTEKGHGRRNVDTVAIDRGARYAACLAHASRCLL